MQTSAAIPGRAGVECQTVILRVGARSTIPVILAVFYLSLRAVCATPPAVSGPVIAFRQGSDILYPDYKLNRSGLALLESTAARHGDVISSGQGHIRLVACLAPEERDDPAAINMAATRAAVVRTYLCGKLRMLAGKQFAFYLCTDASLANSVQAVYCPGPVPADAPDDIYYSTRRDDPGAIRAVLSKYGDLPFISARREPGGTPAADLPAVPALPGDGKTAVAIYYRWDQSTLDSLYLSNRHNLHKLDSLLVSESARRIDTLTISAFASPEGGSAYNKRLSERRAVTLRDYIVSRYPGLGSSKIVTAARGENWDGMERLAENDANLPSKDKVLGILRSSMDEQQKQEALTRLDGGTTYYRYILPRYYPYLRLGAMVFMSYTPQTLPAPRPAGEPSARPDTLASAAPEGVAPQPEPGLLPAQPQPEFLPAQPQSQPPVLSYPFALKTNLLYDLAGAANLGVEIPLGERWSVIGDAAYAYWRTSNHLYALQTLEYGVSGRYWLPVSERRKRSNPEWGKPLRGWNFGVYGRYWQRYDVQWKDGCQGDGSWSAGVTAGYAFPVGRNLSLEAGLGAGYFSTSQYRTYDRPLYDTEGDYHLIWRETGRWSGFTLTKVNFSLVWLVETKKGGKR